MIRSMRELIEQVKKNEPCRLAVAVAQDEDVLCSVTAAATEGLVYPILVGDRGKIEAIAINSGLSIGGFEIVDVADKGDACMTAAALVRDGKADVLMKGFVDTSVIMKAILNKENGLRGTGHITHDLVLELPGFDRLIHVTDSAMMVTPMLEDKVFIARNAVAVAHALGNPCPKVAALCAVEKVNEKMPCTLDAAALKEMNQSGEITGCVIDGPLALDNAVSAAAAAHKGIQSPVAGDADILLVPDIEAGNMLGKAAEYFAHAQKAGVIVGAGVPIALTSRASSAQSKLNTIALACLLARTKGEA